MNTDCTFRNVTVTGTLSLANPNEIGTVDTFDNLYVNNLLDVSNGDIKASTLEVLGDARMSNAIYIGTSCNSQSLAVSQSATANTMAISNTLTVQNSGTFGSVISGDVQAGTLSVNQGLTANAINTTDITTATLEVTGDARLSNALYLGTDLNVSDNAYIQGDLFVTGSITSGDNPSATDMEVLYWQLGGNSAQNSNTITLKNNTSNTTNYCVMPSIYYNVANPGGGTYSAMDSSTAIKSIIITNITTTGFGVSVEKNNGDSTNVLLIFLVVYNVTGSDYPKSY
jgi:hypothetical protein